MILIVISLHFMIRNGGFYHENTKVGKHQNFLGIFSGYRLMRFRVMKNKTIEFHKYSIFNLHYSIFLGG